MEHNLRAAVVGLDIATPAFASMVAAMAGMIASLGTERARATDRIVRRLLRFRAR